MTLYPDSESDRATCPSLIRNDSAKRFSTVVANEEWSRMASMARTEP